MSKTLGELCELYEDAYKRLGGVVNKDARLLRRLWEDANKADTLRHQRDEALRVLRDILANYKYNKGEGLGIGPVTRAKNVLAQYESEDAE